jgi:hypothetical protein
MHKFANNLKKQKFPVNTLFFMTVKREYCCLNCNLHHKDHYLFDSGLYYLNYPAVRGLCGMGFKKKMN